MSVRKWWTRIRQGWRDATLDSKLVVFVGAISALCAVAQFISAVKSGNDTARQVDRLIRAQEKTSESAKLSNDLNRAALAASQTSTERTIAANDAQNTRTVTAMVEGYRNDQRAWIGIRAGDLIFPHNLTDGTRIRFSLAVSNSGRSPAVDVRARLAWTLYSNEGPRPEFDRILAGIPDTDMGIILPNSDRLHNAETVPMSQGDGLNLYSFGRFRYSDAYGQRHWTRFCFVMPLNYKLQLGQDIAFKSCPFFNSGT